MKERSLSQTSDVMKLADGDDPQRSSCLSGMNKYRRTERLYIESDPSCF